MKNLEKIVFNSETPDEKRRKTIIENIIVKFEFVESKILSKSVLNREIPIIYIGNKEKSILLTGAYHGMEWLTSLVLLKFIYDLCEKIQDDIYYKNLIKKRGLAIVPCVNPDGVEISLKGENASGEYKSLVEKIGEVQSWQANARGVDINHNFNAGWEDLHRREIEMGITGPNRTRYGGEYPESEPETQAIVNLCRKMNFGYAFAFHSQGEEIYWEYSDKTPSQSLEIAQKMAHLSGYTVSFPKGLAVGGGFKDWFINELGKPGFTIEIGKGKNPLPLSDFNQIYSKIEKMLYYILELDIS